MNFDYENKKIKDLLSIKDKIFIIPRYQRDYSWELPEISEFFNDIITCITYSNELLSSSEYFFGTVLLGGSLTDSQKELDVIDGQQRLTTMTILLSALGRLFYEKNEVASGDGIWSNYILKTNDDGEVYKVIKIETINNFFEYYIQQKEQEKSPIDEEQEKMENAYKYFIDQLKEETIKTKLNLNKESITYLDILKTIRNQILNSNIIVISSKDKNSGNKIFEILNAKGKKLEDIDLIKNQIFKKITITEPTDTASNIWNEIKSNLTGRKERVELNTFFRQYWASKYKRVSSNQLYNSFNIKIKEVDYNKFLKDLSYNSEIYMKIIAPSIDDYDGRKEKQFIVENLKYLNDTFKIKQVRVALLAIFRLYFDNKLLDTKKLRDLLKYLHDFHFVYNGLCSKSTNVLDSRYTSFSIALANAKTKDNVNEAINKLKESLDKIYPKYPEFEERFINLEYSKNSNEFNVMTKYVLNNIEKYYSNEDIQKIDSSIEHIINENNDNKITLNIGNLLLLEQKINEEASNVDFTEKKKFYNKSAYKFVKYFISNYNNFGKENIENRAKELSKFYYEKVLSKKTI